jgi:glycosyltransferase involved in cell wall biosynthesis
LRNIQTMDSLQVTYDYQIFCLTLYGGISRYFCEVASRLATRDGVTPRILAPCYINRCLREVEGVPVSGISVPKLPKTGRILLQVNKAVSSMMLRAACPDIVHETYYSAKRLAPRGARTVITVHDMIHEKFRHHVSSADTTGAMKALAVQHADFIICVSENTRKDLVELLGVPSDKISVVYHGCSLPRHAMPSPHSIVDGSYLLYVGMRGGYKNAEGLLRAFAQSTKLKADHKLIFFGGGAFSREEQATIAGLGLTSKQVLQLSGGDIMLTTLYAHASAFVYPSLYEGFGMPPLEAMTFGCPVVSSNTSSMPEVLGAAAMYFNPTNIEEMRFAIELVLDSQELRSDLVRRGREHVLMFSWDRCAMETVQIYQNLL